MAHSTGRPKFFCVAQYDNWVRPIDACRNYLEVVGEGTLGLFELDFAEAVIRYGPPHCCSLPHLGGGEAEAGIFLAPHLLELRDQSGQSTVLFANQALAFFS